MFDYLAHAAAVPAVAISGWLILLLFAFCVVWGLMYTYDYSIGAAMRGLADKINGLPFIGGFTAGKLRDVDDYVLRQMGTALDGIEGLTGRTWDALTYVVKETGEALEAFGADVYVAISNVIDSEIPQQLGGALLPVRDSLAGLRRKVRSIVDTELARLGRGIDGLTRDLRGEVLARQRGIDYVGDRAHAYTDAVADGLSRSIAAQRWWADRILGGEIADWRRITSYAAVGGVALATLTRVFPYWQCTNVRRFNRGMCRMDATGIDALLGLVLGFALPLSLDEFTRTMQGGAEVIAAGLGEFIDEL